METKLPDSFPRAVWSGIEETLGHRRLTAVLGVLGAFGVTATPLFNVEPWWIGPLVLVGLVVTLILAGARIAWLKEHAKRMAHDLGVQDQWRDLAVGGLYGVILQAGNILMEATPAPGSLSEWEKKAQKLIEVTYGIKYAAIFLSDGGYIADSKKGFDLKNARKVMALRHKRFMGLMENPPPLVPNFDWDQAEAITGAVTTETMKTVIEAAKKIQP